MAASGSGQSGELQRDLSPIHDRAKTRTRTIRALGLRKLGQTVEHDDTRSNPRHDPEGAAPGQRAGATGAGKDSTMKQHELRPPKGATHKRKRIGRGQRSGHGTYSTQGH